MQEPLQLSWIEFVEMSLIFNTSIKIFQSKINLQSRNRAKLREPLSIFHVFFSRNRRQKTLSHNFHIFSPDLFGVEFCKFILNFFKAARFLNHLIQQGILFRPPFPDWLIYFLLYLLHQQCQISILLDTFAQNPLVFMDKLFIILFRNQLSLLLENRHDTHIKLCILFNSLNHGDQIMADYFQLLIGLIIGFNILGIKCFYEQLFVLFISF